MFFADQKQYSFAWKWELKDLEWSITTRKGLDVKSVKNKARNAGYVDANLYDCKELIYAIFKAKLLKRIE
jgi:hypothetical protein